MASSLPRKGALYLVAMAGSAGLAAVQLKSDKDFTWIGALDNFPLWISTAPNPTLLLTSLASATFAILGAWVNIVALRSKPAATARQVVEDGNITRDMINDGSRRSQTELSEIGAALKEINQFVVRKKVPTKKALSVIREAILSGTMSDSEVTFFSEIYVQYLKLDGVQSEHIIANLVKDMKGHGYANLLADALADISGEERSKIIENRAKDLIQEQTDTSVKYTELATYAAIENIDQAIDYYREAIRIDHKNTSASIRLGYLLFRHRTIDEAKVFFNIALQSVDSNLYKENLHLAFSNLLILEGKSDEAYEECMAAIGLIEERMEVTPTEHRALHNYAEANLLLGDILSNRGNIQESIECFERSVKAVLDLKELGHYCRDSALGISAGLQRIASLKRNSGGISDGLVDLEEAQRVCKSWIEKEPGDIDARRNLMVMTMHQGDFRIALGERKAARECFAQAMASNEEISEIVPETTQMLRDKSIIFTRIGEIELAEENYKKAYDIQIQALEIVRELSSRDEKNTELKRDVSISLERVSDILINYDYMGALKALNEAMLIRTELSQSDSENKNWLRDLSVCYKKIGVLNNNVGNRSRAIDMLHKSLKIDEQLIGLEPNSPTRKYDMFDTIQCLAAVFWGAGLLEEADNAYYLAKTLIDEIVRDFPEVAKYAEHADILDSMMDRFYGK